MFTFQGVQLTEDQFNLLSWLATVEKGVSREAMPSDWKLGMRAGVESACTFAGIPDKLIYAVKINHIYPGLRNYDRISAIEYFD
jgi:hypothetical protein